MYLKNLSIYLLLLPVVIISSCKESNPPTNETAEFTLQPGFEIELVASEPLLDSPVAMQFDKKGRIWVVEMPGYMRDIDGSDEDFPDGKIVILSDRDNDGRMDERKVFLDSLVAPRTLVFAYNGLLYSNGTALWWTSIENDRPAHQELVDSLYVIGGNIEHQPNGLLYHLDNWIYSAKSNARYKRQNGTWIKEATTARGQWGITHDELGRLYYNDNSNPLIGDLSMPNILISNPFQEIKYGLNQQIATDRRVFPYQATSVNRGYEKDVLDENGKLKTFTSACGPLIYLGDQFLEEYYGNAFVCGPEVNLIKRYIIEDEGGKPTATQAYIDEEFLVSKEETFRPVNLYTGLDGALYIVDLRKGIIQHRAYMTSYLREKILGKGLEKNKGIGKIYKVTKNKKGISPKIDYSKYSGKDYLPLLNSKNHTLRMLAQREIVFSFNQSLKNDLLEIALDGNKPLGQIHSLWALEGLGILNASILSNVLQTTEKQEVVAQIVRLATITPNCEHALATIIEKSILKNEMATNLFLCHVSGKMKNNRGNKSWVDLAGNFSNDPCSVKH